MQAPTGRRPPRPGTVSGSEHAQRISRCLGRQLLCAAAALVLALPGVSQAETADGLGTAIAARFRESVRPTDPIAFAFYRARNYAPLWSANGRLSSQAKSFLALVRSADVEGLSPEDYDPDRLERLLAGAAQDEASLVDAEIALSSALLDYISDSLDGRLLDASTGVRDAVAADPADLEALVQRAFERGFASLPGDLAPRSAAYRRLRDALSRYRAMARVEPSFVAPRRTLGLWDTGVDVAELRRRLHFLGDLTDGRDRNEVFDAGLLSAVLRFQSRHGLAEDGVVGPRTRAALVTTTIRRAEQIEFNLERWRQMPQRPGPRYLVVNIADFGLDVIENDTTVLEMRAIVGKSDQQTPVFSSRIDYLVLNPYWQVPFSIATKEFLPELRRDPGYLHRERIQVLEGSTVVDPDVIDWTKLSARGFPYRFRQRPGADNALGRIKFFMPNRHSVFLHDTPAKALFSRTVRAFSHGCIRLEMPFELATYLLSDQPQWTRPRLDLELERAHNTRVDLTRPVPVHVVYWTAWADGQGRVNFRRDIYRRDVMMEAAFEQMSLEQVR